METEQQKRDRFGGYADGPYILCYVSGNGTTSAPQGNGKCWKYATELLKEYRQRGQTNWALYKLIPLKDWENATEPL